MYWRYNTLCAYHPRSGVVVDTEMYRGEMQLTTVGRPKASNTGISTTAATPSEVSNES